MGLDICAALCGVTRDVTRAAVKRSINDENTILCETDNAKALERTRCLPAKETGDGRTEFSEPEVRESSRCASAIQHCSLSLAKKREQFHACARTRLNFSRSFLRSGDFSLQKCAILCNALKTPFVRLTYDSQCYATQRKRAQFVSLELQISRSGLCLRRPLESPASV